MPSGCGRKQSRVGAGAGKAVGGQGWPHRRNLQATWPEENLTVLWSTSPHIRGRRNVHVSLSGFPNDSSALFLPDTLGTKPQSWLNPTSAPPGDLFFLKCSISRESEGPPPFGKATRWRYFYALSAVGERESWLKIEPVMPSNPVGLGQRQSWDTTHVWKYNSLCLFSRSLFQLSLSQHMDAHRHENMCKHTFGHMCTHTHACACTQAHAGTQAHTCTHVTTHIHMPACMHIQTNMYNQPRCLLVIAVSWTFSSIQKLFWESVREPCVILLCENSWERHQTNFPELTLEWGGKEIKPVNPKANQPWIFIERAYAEAEAPILGPPGVNSWLIGKHSGAGKDWRQKEKGATEDETVEWHHQLDGHEFEQTPGDGEAHGSLVCCSPWGCKE